MSEKTYGTLGEYVDYVAASYIARGLDAFYANILACRFTILLLSECRDHMSELVPALTKPSTEVSGNG